MTKKVGKNTKLRKAISREKKAIDAEKSDIPKTMIFCKPGSSILVKQLVKDFKSTMEPHTIKEVFCNRSSSLKDYVNYATQNHVKSIIYFTHAKSRNKVCDWNESTNYEYGGVYCHMIIMPHGPSFTYRVKEYSLKKDLQTLSGFGMNNCWLQKPPLLVCAGFLNQDKAEYLKAVSSSFQNMLPGFDINKTDFKSTRRAILLYHSNEMPHVNPETQQKLGEVFVFRHFFIRFENKELNRHIRKLGVGKASRNVKLPDLSKYGSISDFISCSGGPISESEMSDLEGEGATIELTQSLKELPGSSGKTAVRMLEVGPRLTLQLIKIQEGVNSGMLLYHRFVQRTKEELIAMEKKKTEKLKLKEKRREQQMKNVEKKRQLKEAHKKKCLDGMKKEKSDDEEEEEEEELKQEEMEEEEENEEIGEEEEDEEIMEEEEVEDIEEDERVEEGAEDEDEEDNDSEEMEEVNDSLDEESDGDDSDDIEMNEFSEDDDLCNEESENSDEESVEEVVEIKGNKSDNHKRKRAQRGTEKNNKKRKL